MDGFGDGFTLIPANDDPAAQVLAREQNDHPQLDNIASATHISSAKASMQHTIPTASIDNNLIGEKKMFDPATASEIPSKYSVHKSLKNSGSKKLKLDPELAKEHVEKLTTSTVTGIVIASPLDMEEDEETCDCGFCDSTRHVNYDDADDISDFLNCLTRRKGFQSFCGEC